MLFINLCLNHLFFSLPIQTLDMLWNKKKLCSTPVGTLSYKAPEMVLSLVPEFDPFKADSWSM